MRLFGTWDQAHGSLLATGPSPVSNAFIHTEHTSRRFPSIVANLDSSTLCHTALNRCQPLIHFIH
jgi:hypothetical protein